LDMRDKESKKDGKIKRVTEKKSDYNFLSCTLFKSCVRPHNGV
jgi:hypothetical protein